MFIIIYSKITLVIFDNYKYINYRIFIDILVKQNPNKS